MCNVRPKPNAFNFSNTKLNDLLSFFYYIYPRHPQSYYFNMSDLFRSKENEFYIELSEERYYSPGEQVLGNVILDLKKATKTHNIKVTLEGVVEFSGRSFVLFSKSALVAESPEGDHRSYYLQPHTHRFPFKINIPSSNGYHIPSTLEIPKLLKVSYRLVAVYNKAYTVLEKLCPTASVSINILEDINVESPELNGAQKLSKSLLLTGESSRKVKVSAVIGKKAAVRGDIVPISVTIEHIGVMVRDRAISAKLYQSVYYGKNKKELFGPKLLREVTSDIEISGPFNFTKTFDLKLPIPSHISPTVDTSGKVFKIQYFIRISVNLNEQNPHHAETEKDIVVFSSIFTVGTYPKLSFCIDDDDDDDDDYDDNNPIGQISDGETYKGSFIDPAEYAQVSEKMKDLDLNEEADQTNDFSNNVEESADEPYRPSADIIDGACRDDFSTELKSQDSRPFHVQPSKTPSIRKPDEMPSLNTSGSFYSPYTAEVISPPLEKLRYGTTNAAPAPLSAQPSPVPGHLENTSSTCSHNRTSSNVSGMSLPDSVSGHSASSSTSPRPPFEIASASSISLPYIRAANGPVGPSSLHGHESNVCMQSTVHSPKLSEQGSPHANQHVTRRESVRWIVPNQNACITAKPPVAEGVEPFQFSPRMDEPVLAEEKDCNATMPMPTASQSLSEFGNHQLVNDHLYHDNYVPSSIHNQDSTYSSATPEPMNQSLSPSPYKHSQAFLSPRLSSPLISYGNKQQTIVNHYPDDSAEPIAFGSTESHGNTSIPQPQHYFPGGFIGMPTPHSGYPY